MSVNLTDIEYMINGLLIDYYNDKEHKLVLSSFTSGNNDNSIINLKMTKQPNSNNRYCYCLDSNLKIVMRNIIESYYESIREYFDEKFTGFKVIMGFITINSVDSTNGVAIHRDISDYTFNMFLNDNYEGGTLIFSGKTDKVTQKYKKIYNNVDQNIMVSIKPEKNKIILHRGYSAHQVEKVTNGTRYNLILWCYEKDINIEYNNEYSNFII